MDDYDLWMARFKDPDGHIVALRHEVPKGLQADGKLIETTAADAQLDWPDLITGHADLWDGAEVEISGWVTPIDVAERHDYFLLVPQPACCIGCLPSNPSAGVEVSPQQRLRCRRIRCGSPGGGAGSSTTPPAGITSCAMPGSSPLGRPQP